MKRIAVLSAVIFCSAVASAQQAPPPEPRKDAPAAQSSVAASEEVRMKTLEDQVRTLAEQLTLLRGELKAMRDARSVEPRAEEPILLTASHVAPGILAPSAPAAVPASPAAAPPQATQTQIFGGASSNAKLLNPDISLIGDFIGTAGHNTVSPSRSLEMHETELGLQAIIDPYARADAFISFGETGVSVEEAYVTFTSLPAGLLLKVGKMRANFGKVNTMHNHVLPFIDRPLVTNNLVGGEDGIDDAGLSVERIIPFPKGIFLSATGQVFRGDSGADDELLFQSHSKNDVSTVAHLRGYKDLTESTNLELGASYARGHNELGTDFITSLYGIDATLRWKPLRRAIYNSFVARSEFIWSQRHEQAFEQRAFGMYASGEYQFKRRWFVGGRYDWSDRAREANLTDKGGSVILTYWPSEFSQIRGQYRFTDYAGDHKANELLLQVLFSLGAHGAHPF